MAHRVTLRPRALEDLDRLYTYIKAQSGRSVARDYIDRIETTCLGLSTFPYRGTKRDELATGLRTFGFERRVTIVFRVGPAEVEILRILYAGRRLSAANING